MRVRRESAWAVPKRLPALVPMVGIDLSVAALPAADAFSRILVTALGSTGLSQHVAVAVSGGADSMALCSLAAGWAEQQGGRVTALTVDHRLREASRSECRSVSRWMREAGIEHHVLAWIGPKPLTAIQEAARKERYRLLLGWCREHKVRFLLVGHHREDQAETVLYRMLRGSGLHGLGGMALVTDAVDVRIVRPLLDWPPDLLRGLLRQRGWGWLEDPSNQDRRFARVRLRQAAPSLAASGISTEVLVALAAKARAAEAAMQEAVAELVAAACIVHPAGYVRVNLAIVAAAPKEMAANALIRLLAAVGGGEYLPSMVAVRTMLSTVVAASPRSTTLGRCRLVVRDADADLWLFREHRSLPAETPLPHIGEQPWDGRFRVHGAEKAVPRHRPLHIRPISPADMRQLRAAAPTGEWSRVPHLARCTLPVLCDESGLAMAPLLGYCRPDVERMLGKIVQMAWKPRHGINGPGCLTKCGDSTII